MRLKDSRSPSLFALHHRERRQGQLLQRRALAFFLVRAANHPGNLRDRARRFRPDSGVVQQRQRQSHRPLISNSGKARENHALLGGIEMIVNNFFENAEFFIDRKNSLSHSLRHQSHATSDRLRAKFVSIPFARQLNQVRQHLRIMSIARGADCRFVNARF